MKVKILRSDNEYLEFDGNYNGTSDLGILSVGGLTIPNPSINSSTKAYGDGELFNSQRLPSRNIEFEIIAKRRNDSIQLKNNLIRFFNNRYDFKVYITYMDNEKWINAKLNGFTQVNSNITDNYQFKLGFYCPDPYFKSIDNFDTNVAMKRYYFAFPFVSLESRGGIMNGVYAYAQEVLVSNNGDIPINFDVKIIANGDVSNPKIIKGDKYILINDTMVDGDIIEIQLSNDRTPLVLKNGVNVRGKLDRGSSLTNMEIQVGGDMVGYSATNGDSNMDVTIYRYEDFLSV